jgi:hypothetical protein
VIVAPWHSKLVRRLTRDKKQDRKSATFTH